MRRIGLVGGMTPESTKDYYAILMELSRDRIEGTMSNPVVIIYSINLQDFIDLMKAGQMDKVIEMLVGVIEKLRIAGAQVGALTANTPHVLFDEMVKRTALPLISIIQTTFEKAKGLGCRRSLLLGTRTTMTSDMYPKSFAAGGMEIVVPDEEEMAFINSSIEKELSIGRVLPETKKRYIGICERHMKEDGVDSVILGCTEIPLILKDGDVQVDLLNTTRVHAEAIFDEAMKD